MRKDAEEYDMKKRIAAVMLALAIGLTAAPAFAEQDTGRLVLQKLFRGMANAATGWMEIPKQMSKVWGEQGPLKGATLGFGKGIGYAVARSVVGGYEILTFPFPAPAEYKPIMQPEFVLSDLPGGSETS